MKNQEWRWDGFTISTDPSILDKEWVADLLSRTYWCEGVSRDGISESIENALTFGLYASEGRQVGFGRVVTDYARFAWLSDVIVAEDFRGRGLGRWLVQTILSYEPLSEISRWLLATRDAHGLYRGFGFSELRDPRKYMILQRGN